MKTRNQVSIAVLAVVSAACLVPGLANAQSTYRSDRNGNPVYNSQDRDNNGNGIGRRSASNTISGNLTTRQGRVEAGSSVTFAYSITNRGSDTRTYRFPSARMFDMEAVRVDVGANNPRGNNGNGRGNGGRIGGGYDGGFGGGRRIVWRHSDDQLSAQMLSEFTLRPGQSRSFLGRWQIGRNVPAGTYEVTAFLTPQRENRVALATTRVIIENDRRPGRDRDDRFDRDDRRDGNNPWDRRGNRDRDNRDNRDNDGRWDDRGGNGGVLDVTDFLRSNTSRYIDQRVTVRGIYRGSGPENNSWLLDGDNVTALVVLGSNPNNARLNDRVTVSGTLRRGRDGRYTLQTYR